MCEESTDVSIIVLNVSTKQFKLKKKNWIWQRSVLMSFVRILKEKIYAVSSINRLIFVMQTHYVFCEEETEL